MIKAFLISKRQHSADYFVKLLHRIGVETVAICIDSLTASIEYPRIYQNVDIVLMDCKWTAISHSMTGADLIRSMLKTNPSAKIIVMMGNYEKETVIAMQALGAKGAFYRYTSTTEIIIKCIKEVHAGRSFFSENIESSLTDKS